MADDDGETSRHTNTPGDGGAEALDPSIEHRLPSTVLATILSRLDPRSLCSAAATCRSVRSCAAQARSFLPSFNLIEIAPTPDLLRPLLPPNPYLRSLRLDCRRLDDGSIGHLARPSLHELSLQNCENLSGKLIAEVGRKCVDLRSLTLSSVAEHRGLLILFSDLEVLLYGCSHLEIVRHLVRIWHSCEYVTTRYRSGILEEFYRFRI